MATHPFHLDIPATVTVQDDRTVIHFGRRLDLPEGEALARFDQESGDIHLEHAPERVTRQQAWLAFYGSYCSAYSRRAHRRIRPHHARAFPQPATA